MLLDKIKEYIGEESNIETESFGICRSFGMFYIISKDDLSIIGVDLNNNIRCSVNKQRCDEMIQRLYKEMENTTYTNPFQDKIYKGFA